jgi:hypothetical protein
MQPDLSCYHTKRRNGRRFDKMTGRNIAALCFEKILERGMEGTEARIVLRRKSALLCRLWNALFSLY